MKNLYQFKPDPSITPYELALVTKELFVILINSLQSAYPSQDDNKLEIEASTYKGLPGNIQRHFIES